MSSNSNNFMSRLSSTLNSALWAILSATSFAIMVTSVHYMEGKFDVFQIVLIRALFGLFLIIPLIRKSGVMVIKTAKMPLHILRTIFGLLAMAALYYAVAVKPLAEVIALTFLIPIFVTIASGIVLRERVGRHRWFATIFGFAGALIIIRPGIVTFDLPVAMVLVSSALYAGAWSCVKILTRTDQASVMIFWMNVLMVPLTALPVLFVWKTPALGDLVPLCVMAFFGWLAHFSQARAFANADASAVMPFDFLRLPVAALLGFLIFSETVDVWVWIGSATIFLSGYYIVLREKTKGPTNKRLRGT